MAMGDLLGLSQVPQLPDMTAGIEDALARNAQLAQQQARQPSKLRNLLGAIGDAISVGAGGQPLYHMRRQAEADAANKSALGQQIASYLGLDDSGLSSILADDPQAGLALYKLKHPAQANQDASIREYEYAKAQGYGGSYMDFLQSKGGPLIANNGDGTFTIVPRGMVTGQNAEPAGAPKPGTVEDGYRFKGGDPSKQENWEPVSEGGATASTPSLTF